MKEPPSNDREDNYGITSIIEFLIFSISDALITVYKDRDDTFPLIHLLEILGSIQTVARKI
jgi:ethanolamine ammonia-lyase large subunit